MTGRVRKIDLQILFQFSALKIVFADPSLRYTYVAETVGNLPSTTNKSPNVKCGPWLLAPSIFQRQTQREREPNKSYPDPGITLKLRDANVIGAVNVHDRTHYGAQLFHGVTFPLVVLVNEIFSLFLSMLI